MILIDIDGTLVKSSLEHWFISFLIRTHRVHPGRLLKLVPLLMKWPIPHWYQLKLFYLRGQSRDIVESWVHNCWKSDIQSGLYSGIVNAIRWFHSAGAHVVLLSGTPRPLAEPLMDWLKIKDIICAEPEIKNRVYTGRLMEPHPYKQQKVACAADWLQERGYAWQQVIAIANAWPDRFLLSQAAIPIVVDPSRRLLRLAKHNSWLINNNPNDPTALISCLKNQFFLKFS